MGHIKSDGFLRRFLLWGLIAGGFTAMVIQYSYAHGKLLCPPFYDDVSYFEDALHRLEILYREGIGALLKDYVISPPHSFFSSFMAMSAFALLGVHDWAPYVANSLIILVLLVFLDRMTPDLTLPRKLGLIAVVLCVPICMQAVYQFRPDVPSAMFAAMGVALLFRRPLTLGFGASHAQAGALVGLALLFKPPTSPLTAIVFVTALVFAALADLIVARPPWRAIARAWLACLWPAILIPLPHYLLTWQETWAYIYEPIFGHSHSIWARQGTIGWHLLYYINGEGGRTMLGRMLWILASINLAGLIVLMIRRCRESLALMLGLLAVAVVAWAVPTKMDVKQEYFGTTFQWLLVFAAAGVLHMLLRVQGAIPLGVAALVIVLSLRAARFGKRQYDRGSDAVVARNRLVHDVYASLVARHFPPYARVYLTTTGYLNAGVLDYFYRRDFLHALNVSDNAYTDDLKMHAESITASDYVIASEPDNGEAWAGFIASGGVQDKTLQIVRSNPDFQQLAAFPTRNGKHYYLFGRIRPFFGWLRAQGLVAMPAAGRAGRPLAYQAAGPSAMLVIGDGAYDKLRLVVRASAAGVPRTITVRLQGKRIARWKLSASDEVGTFTVPFNLNEGGEHQVELAFDPPAEPEHPIIFSQLEFPPDDRR